MKLLKTEQDVLSLRDGDHLQCVETGYIFTLDRCWVGSEDKDCHLGLLVMLNPIEIRVKPRNTIEAKDLMNKYRVAPRKMTDEEFAGIRDGHILFEKATGISYEVVGSWSQDYDESSPFLNAFEVRIAALHDKSKTKLIDAPCGTTIKKEYLIIGKDGVLNSSSEMKAKFDPINTEDISVPRFNDDKEYAIPTATVGSILLDNVIKRAYLVVNVVGPMDNPIYVVKNMHIPNPGRLDWNVGSMTSRKATVISNIGRSTVMEDVKEHASVEPLPIAQWFKDKVASEHRSKLKSDEFSAKRRAEEKYAVGDLLVHIATDVQYIINTIARESGHIMYYIKSIKSNSGGKGISFTQSGIDDFFKKIGHAKATDSKLYGGKGILPYVVDKPKRRYLLMGSIL